MLASASDKRERTDLRASGASMRVKVQTALSRANPELDFEPATFESEETADEPSLANSAMARLRTENRLSSSNFAKVAGELFHFSFSPRGSSTRGAPVRRMR